MGTTAVAGDDATSAEWWPCGALPPLAFDHAEILGTALGPSGVRCQPGH
ncbi:hypothetical protein [Streptomyces sp. NPDC001591]